MNIDELNAAVRRGEEAQANAYRNLESASPSQRAEAEQLVREAKAGVEAAKRELAEESIIHGGRSGLEDKPSDREVDGFAGSGSAPAMQHQAEQEKTQQERAKAEQQKEREADKDSERAPQITYHSDRLGAGLGGRVTVTPDNPEARADRAAAARAEKVGEQVKQEQADRQREKTAAQAREKADKDRAARIYDGMPSRGISTERYIQAEAEGAAAKQPATDAYLVQREKVTGIPHRNAEPNEDIKGKVVGVRELDGKAHTIVEREAPPPQRVMVEGEVKGQSIGKQVEIKADEQRRIKEVTVPEIDRTRGRGMER